MSDVSNDLYTHSVVPMSVPTFEEATAGVCGIVLLALNETGGIDSANRNMRQ